MAISLGFAPIPPEDGCHVQLTSANLNFNLFTLSSQRTARPTRVMDPHSRISQFNHRTPRTGSFPPHHRFVEPSARVTLGKSPQNSAKTPSSGTPPTTLRVKQDEKHRKDMYLAFAHNALHLKENVCPHVWSSDHSDLIHRATQKHSTSS
jgi:hypothetical protein